MYDTGQGRQHNNNSEALGVFLRVVDVRRVVYIGLWWYWIGLAEVRLG